VQYKHSRTIIAAAGSGKTTQLVADALSRPDGKVAVVTYTNNNHRVIHSTFARMNGVTPSRVDVCTWFAFLLHECARPYQRSTYTDHRIRAISFPKGRSAPYVPYADRRRYYFADGEEIYADKLSRFVMDCEKHTGGLVTARLRALYDAIFIDELQDLAGYDLELLEVFMRSGIAMHLVGDPRQSTYATNHAAKNRRYRKMGLLEKVREWEAAGLCDVESHARSFRCNQAICDFADNLWPELPATQSHNQVLTGHDGVFRVRTPDVHAYVRAFCPILLRYDCRTHCHGYSALNFGEAKGMTFDRVLVLPHGPIEKYLRTSNREDVTGSLTKFYVAVTRARSSVAFLYDGDCNAHCLEWRPDE
jgi:DNA helicase II / ATP-dependent DNA helicase PcrA